MAVYPRSSNYPCSPRPNHQALTYQGQQAQQQEER
jgi:hypothetical protein